MHANAAAPRATVLAACESSSGSGSRTIRGTIAKAIKPTKSVGSTTINCEAPVSPNTDSTNDAPIATGVAGLSNSSSQDYNVALHDAFSDPDGNVTDLVFAIAGTPDPAIFQSVSIDAATGTMSVVLQAGASGQAALSVIATDASGATASTDVGFDTDSSSDVAFIGVTATENVDGTWTVTGTVVDSTPDDGESDAATVELGGAFDGTANVEDDGSFSFTGERGEGESFTTTAFDGDGTAMGTGVHQFDE